jgi:ParB/RepB/Spo0J family partition protein
MSPEFREIALDKLFISPYNVRKDLGDLSELIDSIMEMGVLEPIVVRPMGEGYEIIAGSRRARAAQEAGLTTIPARVLELTDVQAILTSLIENIQRKDLSLAERVETYQQLQALEPEYRSQRGLAKAVRRSHRKIGEDFQAYEIALKLQPQGIRVESDFPRTSPERQQGTALPEYHAVLLHQAMSYLIAEGVVAEEEADEQLVKLARLIAELSQDAAKVTIAEVKAGGQLAAHLFHQQRKAGRHGTFPRSKSKSKQGEDAGLITCACCNRVLKLTHRADGTHTVSDTPFTGQPTLPAPDVPLDPAEVGRTPEGTLVTEGTPQPILKQTAGYTINSFPKGLHTILTPQTSGFWGRLTDSPANPDFTETDMPQSIWTVDPWVGCLWGLS